MNREALWSALTEACSEHGYLTDHTYDRIDAVIDSIREDDAP